MNRRPVGFEDRLTNGLWLPSQSLGGSPDAVASIMNLTEVAVWTSDFQKTQVFGVGPIWQEIQPASWEGATSGSSSCHRLHGEQLVDMVWAVLQMTAVSLPAPRGTTCNHGENRSPNDTGTHWLHEEQLINLVKPYFNTSIVWAVL